MNAAKLSFKYATQYYEKFPKSPEVEKAYIKVRGFWLSILSLTKNLQVKNKYFGFSAMHILYKYNLAQEKYIQLATNPETLIENLYKDDRILKQAESVNLNCPGLYFINASYIKMYSYTLSNMCVNMVGVRLISPNDIIFSMRILYSVFFLFKFKSFSGLLKICIKFCFH